MKAISQRHEATILFERTPIDGNAKVGESTKHKQVVDSIHFFEPINYEDNRTTYIKITLRKDFIIDLAKEIQEIESVTVDGKVEEDLPF